jgi:hypothetical protein
MAKERDGGATPREADFVIAHPEHGLLVVEVKGGGIERDGLSGAWRSIDRRGRTHEIKDPGEQAKRNFYGLLNWLGQSPATRLHGYFGGHAVAFPDTRARQLDLGLDLPPEIVLDSDDLADTESAVRRAMRYWKKSNAQPLNREAMQGLISILARSWQARLSLASLLRQEERDFERLTEEQFFLLDFLNAQPRALVTGCAGSGKTFLAIEKAKRLANQGFRTLLTCYNKNLADSIRAALQPLTEGLHVQHYHALAWNLLEAAGHSLPDLGDPGLEHDHFFNETLPALLYDASGRIETRFDAIVVDEGQDFRETWWLGLLELLTNPDQGVFYVFYDANQCIYTDQATPPFQDRPYPLTRNLRNTQAIHRHIARHYDESVVCAGPEGRPPRVVTAADLDAALRDQLARLTDEGIPAEDIVVLTAASKGRSRWRDGQRLGGCQLVWRTPDGPGQVRVSTIHGFKGLESPVVIVTEFEESTSDQLALVAHSRARSELIILNPAA